MPDINRLVQCPVLPYLDGINTVQLAKNWPRSRSGTLNESEFTVNNNFSRAILTL